MIDTITSIITSTFTLIGMGQLFAVVIYHRGEKKLTLDTTEWLGLALIALALITIYKICVIYNLG